MTDDKQHLREKANELLQEFRIVLPGTQALLGFQLIAFFNAEFYELPKSFQYLHFAAFILTTTSVIALVAPVAFQQIGEGGHTTGRFLRYARGMLNGAMFLLLLAISCEVLVVSHAIGLSPVLSAIFTGAVFLTGAFFWYFYIILQKKT